MVSIRAKSDKTSIVLDWLRSQNESIAHSAIKLIETSNDVSVKVKHHYSDILDWLAEKSVNSVEAGQGYVLIQTILTTKKAA